MKRGSRGPAPSGNQTRAIRIYPENLGWYDSQPDGKKSEAINKLITKARKIKRPSPSDPQPP